MGGLGGASPEARQESSKAQHPGDFCHQNPQEVPPPDPVGGGTAPLVRILLGRGFSLPNPLGTMGPGAGSLQRVRLTISRQPLRGCCFLRPPPTGLSNLYQPRWPDSLGDGDVRRLIIDFHCVMIPWGWRPPPAQAPLTT